MHRITTSFLLVVVLTTDFCVIASDPLGRSASPVPTNPTGLPIPVSILDESSEIRSPLDVGSADLTPTESELELESQTDQEIHQLSLSQSQEPRYVN
jgi:hypothetical protein